MFVRNSIGVDDHLTSEGDEVVVKIGICGARADGVLSRNPLVSSLQLTFQQ